MTTINDSMASTSKQSAINFVKDKIIDAVDSLVSAKAISVSGHANFSAKQGDNIVITRTGNVHHLSNESFVVVSPLGKVLEGTLEDSNAEILDMHTQVYKERSEIGAIVHTHAPNLTAFAIAHRRLGVHYEPLIRFGQSVDLPIIPWAPRGTKESVDAIVNTIANSGPLHAVLLANHGVLVFGPDIDFVSTFLIVLEEAAKVELKSIALGGAKDFPSGALEKVQKEMHRAR